MKKGHRAFPQRENQRERTNGGRGRAGEGSPSPLTPTHTDWLRHDLTISGPADTLQKFAGAAAGAGALPWHYPDLDHEEIDRFHALVNPPDGSPGLPPEAARTLARELREASFQHQTKIRDNAATCRACPFDLQSLIPVPAHILQSGPVSKLALLWLQANWGTTQALRHVRALPIKSAPKRRKHTQLNIEFWSADWTPWMAFKTIRQNWPGLTFTIRPDYSNG